MSKTFYFSYDEEGFNFFDNISDLISSNARMEDCYVYQGNVTEQYIRDDDNDTRETCVLEYIGNMENKIEKLKAQCGIFTEKYGGTMVFPSVYYQKKQKCKALKEENKKLKEQILPAEEPQEEEDADNL